MKRKNLIICVVVLLGVLSWISPLLSTRIGSSSRCMVVARIVDGKRQSRGPLFATGRLYGMDPTEYISLAFYADRERPEVPLFFVMSDFSVPEQDFERGWGSTDPEAKFKYMDKDIHVPVAISARSYLWAFPSVKENNVFVLSADGSLQRLPVSITANAQMDRILDEVVYNRNCMNYREAVLKILREDSGNAQQGYHLQSASRATTGGS